MTTTSFCLTEELTNRFSLMGENLGVAHQLDNDAHDLYDLLYPKQGHTVIGKTDLLRGKKTLPVVLAAQETPFQEGVSQETSRTALETGIVQTRGISLWYRVQARTLFEHIESEFHEDSTLLRLLLHF